MVFEEPFEARRRAMHDEIIKLRLVEKDGVTRLHSEDTAVAQFSINKRSIVDLLAAEIRLCIVERMNELNAGSIVATQLQTRVDRMVNQASNSLESQVTKWVEDAIRAKIKTVVDGMFLDVQVAANTEMKV